MSDKQRSAVTIGVVILYYLLSAIPLYHYPKLSSYSGSVPGVGLFELGLAPIYGGFMFVEIISFLILPFKGWRNQGLEGRKKIHGVQIILMVLMSALQGWGISESIQSIDPDVSFAIFGMPGLAAQIILCSCLVGGVLIFYAMASAVTRFGMVNGFILFLFVQPLGSTIISLAKGIQTDLRLNKAGAFFLSLTRGPHLLTLDQKMNFIYFLLAVGGIGFVLFQKKKKMFNFFCRHFFCRPEVTYQAKEMSYRVKTSPIPQTITGGLGFLLVAVQMIWFHNGISSYDGMLRNVLWGGSETLDLIVTSYLLWLLFTNAYWVDHHLEGRATWLPDKDKLRPCFVVWLSVTALAVFVKNSFTLHYPSATFMNFGSIFLDPIFILTTVVLGLEMVEKWKFEQAVVQRVCLAEMDNVEMVQLWVAQLKETDVFFHVEGLRYRQLTQFFAPYLKMRLFVDERNATEAADIIRLGEVKQI